MSLSLSPAIHMPSTPPQTCARCRKPKPAEAFKSLNSTKAPLLKTCLPCRMYFRKHYSSKTGLPRSPRQSVHPQEDQEKRQRHGTDDSALGPRPSPSGPFDWGKNDSENQYLVSQSQVQPGPERNSDSSRAAQSEQANSIVNQVGDPSLSLFHLPQIDPDRSCPIDGCTSCFIYSIRV
ncbi:uncharacterized protein ACHE_80768S [Aspergillus chevalieri]|uniref:Uncharacterized protein n=1 Tax=Aspergillus chevalieri TaxID=182096 RepID=A0A7R7ZSG5_ASPCH|nr:uncharacterized protein ACHE_80768S [Aspergillus chevalieri]BCR92868.1 hypothetical protein ACHE_80768S [Aspergillus chevalieri]